MIPDSSSKSYSAENILLLATEELRSTLVPMILAARESYYETYIDYPLVPNKSHYPIPERAIGGLASNVQFIINNSVTNLAVLYNTDISTVDTGSYPKGFYFENDNICIYPTPNVSNGTIRLRYFQKPSFLVKTSEAAQITAVDEANGTVTIQDYPSTWSSGIEIDFVSNKTPHKPYAIDITVDSISAVGNVFKISPVGNVLPTDRNGDPAVKVGDWVSLAGYTPIPEIFSEFFTVLAQATAVKVLESKGDLEDLSAAKAKLDEYMNSAIRLITPRDQWGLKKVKSDWRNW